MPHRRPRRAGVDDRSADLADLLHFVAIGGEQRLERRLGGPVHPPIGARIAGDAGGQADHATVRRFAQHRIERGNHGCLRADIERQDLRHFLRIDRRNRPKLPQHGGVEHENVERRPTLADRGAEPRDAVGFGQVERRDRRRSARIEDRVLNVLKPLRGTRGQHDMRAGCCQRQRGCGADAPAGTGDERNLVGEGFVGHSARLHLEAPPLQWRGWGWGLASNAALDSRTGPAPTPPLKGRGTVCQITRSASKAN